MKVTIEVDCTPEEARAFMGLPDVNEANTLYVEAMTRVMQGATNPAQLKEFADQLAPMGQHSLKMFQSFVRVNCVGRTRPLSHRGKLLMMRIKPRLTSQGLDEESDGFA